MNFPWIFIASFFVANNVYGKDLCKRVTTFDALCKKDDILYILSANPCKSKNSISVTVIDMKNTSHYSHVVIERDIEEPIPIWNHEGKGAVVIMYLLPASDEVRDYRKTRLDVNLFFVDIEKYKKNAKRGDLILEVKFPMFTDRCQKKTNIKVCPSVVNATCDSSKETCQNVQGKWGCVCNPGYTGKNCERVPGVFHDVCHHKHSLGDFSSMCIIMRNSSVITRDMHVEPGIYIIITDVCTVPYSTTIITLLFSGYTVKETFTQDKTDKYIPISRTQSKCGLVLLMHDYGIYLHVELKYGCGGVNITIINGTYATQTGMICPLSPCKPSNLYQPLKQECKVPWIYGKDAKTAHIEVLLKICRPQFSIWWNIHIDEASTSRHVTLLPFEEKEELKVGEMKRLRLGRPVVMHDPVSKTNGYLYLDWGMVSLFIRGTDLVYVTVLRHYPSANDTIPLFRTEFWVKDVDKKKICPAHTQDKSLKTGLTIAGVGMLILIVVIVFLIRGRRRRRQLKGVGLPYQIQLGEETNQDIEMDDEVQNELQY